MGLCPPDRNTIVIFVSLAGVMFRALAPVRRRLIVGALVTSLLTGATGITHIASHASADSVDDAKRKVRQMADKLEKAENEVDVLSEDLVTAQNDKELTDQGIATTKVEIAAKETELGGLQQQMSDLAVQAFVGGGRGGSLTGLLTPGNGPNESVQKQYLTEIALNAGYATTDELDALITDLDDLRATLQEESDRSAELAKQIEEKKAETEKKVSEYQSLLKKAEQDLGQAIRDERARRAAKAAADARAQAAAIAAARGSGGSASVGSSYHPTFDPSSIPPASSRASIAVAAARSQLGVPYIAYKAVEGVGFDCSGLTMWAWAQAGVSLPHQSRRQQGSTTNIPIEYIEPGDLVYFYNPISHVGIYIGNGQMIDAPATGKNVRIAAVNFAKVTAVSRPG